ncbi:isoleucine--tRNA ligase, partial [Candidatus Bathyarchaeota archaeon]|nr:isoleucine--tRNA ligase [Candidatus Bathyarchaeota archaeon]
IRSKREIEESVTIRRFIQFCKRYAQENARIQTSIFKDLGVWMDWERPYLTYKNEYIESVWWTVKRAEEKGLLQKGLKVVHWCPRCETALAGYEVTDEYRTVKDQSIYVKFPVEGRQGEYILIWTTTPWTLPANLAVMVNPDIEYSRVRVGDEIYILADARRTAVFGEQPIEVVETFKGERLCGVKYRPPLLGEVKIQSDPKLADAHRVVLSREYVSMEEGTGCVHCAPGHGEEDFEIGQANRLPVISPVDNTGRFTEEAGKYHGRHVFDVNQEIIEDLKSKSLLLKASTIEHQYPHCWRCKSPLILRATEQWFIKITAVKQRLFEENEKIRWVPEWAGSRRFRDWLAGARDWVVSRQRYWGTPLPIWICSECGRRIVVGSERELREKVGGLEGRIDLHRQDVDSIRLVCECGGSMSRVPDIVDVWMDSGVASWASLQYPQKESEFKKWWPADLIVEAHDQTRGWFYSQLGAGIVAFDTRPYKSVLMHSHTFNAEGQKMSKSLGNFISPQEVIKEYGRDSLRLYELQRTVWEDFNFSTAQVAEALRDLKVIWNVYSFASIYMNLDSFRPQEYPVGQGRLRVEDRWLISKTESLKLLAQKEMENLNVHRAARVLVEFALEDLSRWYIRLVRRRFWQEKKSPDKLAAYSTLYYTLKTWILLSAPFIPFFAEKLYQTMVRPVEPELPESVHMCCYPEPRIDSIEVPLEENMELTKELVSAVSSARQSAKMKLRQPVSRIVVVAEDPTVKRALKEFEGVICSQANTRRVDFVDVGEEHKLRMLKAIPNFRAIGPAFKKDANLVAEAIRGLEGGTVFSELRERGVFEIDLQGRKVKLTPEMITFREEMAENLVRGDFSRGRVYVDISVPKRLIAEGLVRDVVRRAQEMRRQLDLPVDAYVSAYVIPPGRLELEWLRERRDYIAEEVRAKRLQFLDRSKRRPPAELWKSWVIDGRDFSIGLRQIRKKSLRKKRGEAEPEGSGRPLKR